MGNLIFRLLPNGTAVVSQAPFGKKLKFSEGQKAHQERFSEAAFYARQAAKDHPIYAELAAEAPMKTAYNFALSDWFNPPMIHRIERGEGSILVEASDNVMVTKVQVKILNEEGKILEKGEGIRREGDWWEFASHAEGKTIMAEAWDLPGHVTRLVL